MIFSRAPPEISFTVTGRNIFRFPLEMFSEILVGNFIRVTFRFAFFYSFPQCFFLELLHSSSYYDFLIDFSWFFFLVFPKDFFEICAEYLMEFFPALFIHPTISLALLSGIQKRLLGRILVFFLEEYMENSPIQKL